MAPAAARAELESLLRARKLDRTLTVASPLPPVAPADRVVPSGVAALDTALGGGMPRGQISELVGPASSGRTAVLHQLLAQATSQGELAAVIDVLDTFDPAVAAAQGVVLERLLWVRSESKDAVGRAIKALNLVISAGGFGLVVFDAGGVPARPLRQLPFTTWLRVHRVLEGSDTACVLLADAPLARSTGGASVRLEGAAAGGRAAPPSVTQPPATERAGSAPDFHARVRANRYIAADTTGRTPARARPGRHGLWQGFMPHARRFAGMKTGVEIHFSLRGATCSLVVATVAERSYGCLHPARPLG